MGRDDVLDNVTFYWLTNTGISSAQLYRENKFGFFKVQGVKIPVGVSVFPDELYEAPRHTVGRDYGRSQSLRLSAAIRDGWARCPERMGRLFGFVDPGDIALFGLPAVVLGQGSMTRFSDAELNLSRRIGDT